MHRYLLFLQQVLGRFCAHLSNEMSGPDGTDGTSMLLLYQRVFFLHVLQLMDCKPDAVCQGIALACVGVHLPNQFGTILVPYKY